MKGNGQPGDTFCYVKKSKNFDATKFKSVVKETPPIALADGNEFQKFDELNGKTDPNKTQIDFETADVNKDGFVSEMEARASHEMLYHFQIGDTNGDGQLDP